jgi:hypothetical protein
MNPSPWSPIRRAHVQLVPLSRNSHVEPNSETTAEASYQGLDTTQKEANPNTGGNYAELQLHPIYAEVCQRGN